MALKNMSDEDLEKRTSQLIRERQAIYKELGEIQEETERRYQERQAEQILATLPDGAVDALIRVGTLRANAKVQRPNDDQEGED